MGKKKNKIIVETYRDIPHDEVEKYADFRDLNIETHENYREAAQALFAIEYAPKVKWKFDKENKQVIDENGKLIFKTDELTCPDFVIEEVAKRFNRIKQRYVLGSNGYIDKYLLWEGDCSSEDRELITEQIAENYYNITWKTAN